jgi:hypothetical protein
MPRYEGLKVWRFGDGRFGSQDITTPSIKSLNHPLSSTFLHFNPLIKISVSNNLSNKPHQIAFKSLYSLFQRVSNHLPGSILSIPNLRIWCVGPMVKPYFLAYKAIWISGYLGYKVCYYIGDITTFFTFPPKFGMIN